MDSKGRRKGCPGENIPAPTEEVTVGGEKEGLRGGESCLPFFPLQPFHFPIAISEKAVVLLNIKIENEGFPALMYSAPRLSYKNREVQNAGQI